MPSEADKLKKYEAVLQKAQALDRSAIVVNARPRLKAKEWYVTGYAAAGPFVPGEAQTVVVAVWRVVFATAAAVYASTVAVLLGRPEFNQFVQPALDLNTDNMDRCGDPAVQQAVPCCRDTDGTS